MSSCSPQSASSPNLGSAAPSVYSVMQEELDNQKMAVDALVNGYNHSLDRVAKVCYSEFLLCTSCSTASLRFLVLVFIVLLTLEEVRRRLRSHHHAQQLVV